MAGKFQVDSVGFRKRVAWRGAFGAISELISNALDEKITRCSVRFEHIEGRRYLIEVEDDSPDGFRNLEESYVLYADSYKAGNPEQRGRFNVGEKVAIAICSHASICSTTGTVVFGKDSTRRNSDKRASGTKFCGEIVSSRDEYQRTVSQVWQIIPPEGIELRFNGQLIQRPELLATITTTLPTITANEDGDLMRTERKTQVHVYRRRAGDESGMIYELGIPVVKVDHPYLIDVRQKVPLSTDRNSVTPGYYRRLCAAVLDGTFDKLTEDEVRSKGITEGLAEASSDAAVQTVMEKQHGSQRFVPDPGNREATGELTAQGYTSVAPNAYDRDTWARIRQAAAVPSGSDLMPRNLTSMVPFNELEITPAMRRYEAFAKMVCREVLGKTLSVTFTANTGLSCVAQGGGDSTSVRLTLHVKMLGASWFSDRPASSRENVDLLIHELGHHLNDQDCTRAFCNQVTMIAAKLFDLAMRKPELFAEYR